MKGNRSTDEALEGHYDKRPKRAATSVHVTLETQKKALRSGRLAMRDEGLPTRPNYSPSWKHHWILQ